MKNSATIRKITYSAMFLVIALFLPFLTGQVPQIGSMLLRMHLPVLLAGFICGPVWGLAVGMIAPLMRSLIFSMPPILSAAVMTFELGAYGLIAGLMYKAFNKNTGWVIPDLIVAMLGGRIIWGIASYVVYAVDGGTFTLSAFIAGAFINAIPGIVLQLVLIPLLVFVFKRAKLMPADSAAV